MGLNNGTCRNVILMGILRKSNKTDMPSPPAPIHFTPLYQQRVWGGREMQTRLGRALPADGQPYGESWDVVDRPEAASVVGRGPWAGWTLGRLWRERRDEVFGVAGGPERFPLLCKLLDARDKLSVQVHPPQAVCAALQGQPKDEVWYLLDVEPGADLYAGLRRGATREALAASLREGGTAALLHVLRPQAGESIFLPSGRLHAIGAGLLILEIQQNSDTTYRVYDWDRVGLDGQPRQLHIEQAMASIDFADIEPSLRPSGDGDLVRCAAFLVERRSLAAGTGWSPDDQRFRIVAVAAGAVGCGGDLFRRGDYFLVPARGAPVVAASGAAVILVAGLP